MTATVKVVRRKRKYNETRARVLEERATIDRSLRGIAAGLTPHGLALCTWVRVSGEHSTSERGDRQGAPRKRSRSLGKREPRARQLGERPRTLPGGSWARQLSLPRRSQQ